MLMSGQNWWKPMSELEWLQHQGFRDTLVLILIIVAVRFIVIRALEGKKDRLTDVRRRWISIVQNTSIVIIVLGLIFIWSPELSTFALSLTAFAVAMVLATKEYLLCIVGAVYRAASRPFTVGDWIEIQGMRGEVIVEGILTTRLQELGTGASHFEPTGRVLTLPNSVLLTQTVFNETYRKRYLHHQFLVTIDPGIDPTPIAASALKMLETWVEGKDALAERYWSMVQQRFKTDLPSRKPQVALETTHLGKINFAVTVFCAAKDAAPVQNMITEHILRETAAKLKVVEGS